MNAATDMRAHTAEAANELQKERPMNETVRPLRWGVLFAALAVVVAAGYMLGMARSTAGAGEDIQVHGSWSLELTDADGQLVATHQFSNALTTTGALGIAALLADEVDTSGLGVRALRQAQNLDCAPYHLAVEGSCAPYSAVCPLDSQEFEGSCFPMDDSSVTVSDGMITVTAKETWDTAGQVHAVQAYFAPRITEEALAEVFSGQAEGDYSAWGLTRKELDAPIAVEAGQTMTLIAEITLE
jgi:hypothetical protein